MDISSIDWQSFLVEVAAAQASHRSSDSFPFFSSSFLESLTVDLSRCPLGSSYSFKGAVKHAQVIACIASCLHRILIVKPLALFLRLFLMKANRMERIPMPFCLTSFLKSSLRVSSGASMVLLVCCPLITSTHFS
ncbi:hypothetical protein PAPYR_12870 [Paratrimastix pyriformis]|uniref:Uncharacterized protein n=1 Tax=Paratrimastix pyriformis TaxID=342808 RepID=A0ABQ8U170_9EUKA|nr:hypothetical protein PAPYR_12870 [Paratrimastix pyriformis]